MALILSHCQKWKHRAQAISDQVIPDHVVVRCEEGYDRFALDGDGKWFDGHSDEVVKALKDRAHKISHEEQEKERWEAALYGELSDPRWG